MLRDLVPWGRENRTPAPSPAPASEPSPFLTLHREMNRLFDDVFRAFDGGVVGGLGAWPSVEVSETDDAWRVTAELPGLDEKDLDVVIRDGVLTLRGEKRRETEDAGRGYSERVYGRFERRIALGPDVKEAEASATFRNGLLTVTVPKAPEAVTAVRRIPINGG